MPGRKQHYRSIRRASRRCLLAGLLTATTGTGFADAPLSIAPLPLAVPSPAESGDVRINPFCRPAVTGVVAGKAWNGAGEESRIVLSSAREEADDETAAGGRKSLIGPPVRPTSAPSGVRIRAGSISELANRGAHRVGSVSDESERRAADAAAGTSGTVRHNPHTAADPRAVPQPVAEVDGVKRLLSDEPRPAPESSGISFAFSDDYESAVETTPGRRDSLPAIVRETARPVFEEAFAGPPAKSLSGKRSNVTSLQAKPLVSLPLSQPKASGVAAAPPQQPLLTPQDATVHRPPAGRTIDAKTPAPVIVRPGDVPRTLLVPLQDTSPETAIATVVEAPKAKPKASDPSRLVNGAHPRVDVERAPVIVHRVARSVLPVPSESDVEITPDMPATPARSPESAQASPPASPPQPVMPAPTSPSPTSVAEVAARQKPSAAKQHEPAERPEPIEAGQLTLRPSDVRSLKTDQPIERVEIESAAVCGAVKSAANQVQLIAGGEGATQLVLWTRSPAGELVGHRYSVHVDAAPAAQIDTPETVAATLTQTIAQAFPGTRVQVRYQSGRLSVRGVCPDDESARKIMRMVRAACPMPADDKLTIQ